MYDKVRLIELFNERAIRHGQFTLASGKTSTYYVDKMQITLHAEGLRLVCEGLWEIIERIGCEAVGGMVIGADPIVGGILTLAAQQSQPLEGFLVRKQPKVHGTQQFIEGPLQAGQRVIIVEDVVTTGGSSLQAIERVAEFGAKVAGVVCIVDRLEGGADNFAQQGHRLESLLTIEDFGIAPPPVIC